MDTAEDIINRDITVLFWPGADIFGQIFAASPDPYVQEISRRLVIAKDWDEYEDMMRKVTSTGLYAGVGTVDCTRHMVSTRGEFQRLLQIY